MMTAIVLLLGTVVQLPLQQVPPWLEPTEFVVYRNPGTVRGRNAWDRLNLSPKGVTPAPEPKSL